MLKVKNLNKYYFKGSKNELHVINNTSLELPKTGLITFLGHSGSGKTTLLNVLGGLDSASGSICYDDLNVKNYNMRVIDKYRLENIGYVFQNYNLLQDETVYDNLRLALEIFGITDQEEVDKRIEFALKAIGMYKYRKKMAYALSGGQQQRVSIARALVKKAKIIIADEPTGNLDSENTVEVMNILKKISKTSLVLLVTHDQSIANFYSDRIYQLKDGSVINSYDVDESGKLNVKFDNNIYLKDLNYKEDNNELGNIKIYFDEDCKLDLSIIIKDGTVYIDGPSNLKLLSSTNINVKDEHYKDISKDEIDFNYDNSWFKNGKKIGFFKELYLNLKDGFKKFKNAHRKMKFFYFSLGFIGFLLATSFIIFTNSKTVDTSDFYFNKNYNTIVNEDFTLTENEVLEDVYNDGNINHVFEPVDVSIKYMKNITFAETNVYMSEYKLAPIYDKTIKLYSGNMPLEDNEILVPYQYAVDLVKNGNKILKFNDIIGQTINVMTGVRSEDMKIVGITRDNQGFMYVKENVFLSYSFSKSEALLSTTYRYHKYEKDQKGNKLYEIVIGRDLKDTGRLEVLANYDDLYDPTALSYNQSTDSYGIITKTGLDEYGNLYKESLYIVGYYKYNYEIKGTSYITNKFYEFTWYEKDLTKGIAAFKNDEYVIVEGKDIENDNEVIVPYLSKYKIGEKVFGKVIVGRYTGSTMSMTNKCLSKVDIAYIFYYNNNTLFVSDNLYNVNKYLNGEGLRALNMYDHQYELKLRLESDSLTIFTILFVVLLITSVVFIYFIMRSKMISNIYTIGIYRAIGATRWTLIKRFMAEAFVLALMTCFIGYVIAAGLIGFAITFLNEVFNVSILSIDWLFVIIGSGVMFILIVFFGILPIIMLLRKTPTMICAKYDI